MGGKTKIIIAVVSLLGILSLTLFATPVLAHADQDRTRLRARDQICDGNMFQLQNGNQLRTQEQNYSCDCVSMQIQECTQTRNQTCNCARLNNP